MKRFIFKLLPLILIFVFCFSSSVLAATSSYEYPWQNNEPIRRESDILNHFFNYLDGEYKYLVVRYEDRSNSYDSLICYFSNSPIKAINWNSSQCDLICEDGTRPYCYRSTCSVDGAPSGYLTTGCGYFVTNPGVLYVSYDVFYENNLVLDGVEDNVEEPPAENDFFFGAFEDFADFGEQSSGHYNNAMDQTVTENSNSPNDSVFQKLLQAMVGSLTTNNSISQQISNQLQHFTEQFFNNFAQYSLGLMNDILNTLNEFTGKFDGLLDIVEQLYNSGIGSNGEFGLDNMFSYWLIPSDDFIDSQYDKLIGALPFIDEIQGISDTLLNLFQTVKPKSPTITIHAGSYGFIVLTDDCVIGFDWFLDWKPYTDIFIAVFIYAGLALHLVRQLPGILGGTSAVIGSASGLDKSQKGGKGS